MKKSSRYLEKAIRETLPERMAFIGGPRQVGKTTFALGLLHTQSHQHPAYLNWDVPGTSKQLIQGLLPSQEKIVILDEIHKYKKWRNLVKGLYDSQKGNKSFIVTGSARLDYYRKGGDSLFGRYFYYRLHPFSVKELGITKQKDLDNLIRLGGFPEPYLKGEEKFHRRWQKERLHKVVREDLRDLENVREISLIEHLAQELPNRVGSPLSIQSLKEDLEVDHKTIQRWVQILENLYYCFRIPPFGNSKFRSVKKEQKLYLWDWSLIESSGYRFENLVASQLLKYCHFIEDTEGYVMEVRFVRDVYKKEIDFVVLKDKKPQFAVECKTGETNINANLFYFRKKLNIPKCYQVHLGSKRYLKENIEVIPWIDFCHEMNMP